MRPNPIQFRPNPGAQFEFYRDWKSRHSALVMGLYGGKTFCGAAKIVAHHCWIPGTDTLCVEPTYRLLRQVMIPALTARLTEWSIPFEVNLSLGEIYTPTLGSKLLLHTGAAAEAITGFTVARAWIDEIDRMPAASIPSRNAFRQVCDRVRDLRVPFENQMIIVTGTPEGRGNTIDTIFDKPHDPTQFKVYRGSTYENAAARMYAAQLEKDLGPELAAQYVHGIPVSNAGSALGWDEIEACQTEAATTDGELGVGKYVMGVDLGRTSSATVIWILEIPPGTAALRTVRVEVIRDCPLQTQENRIAEILATRKIVRALIDKTYNPQLCENLISRFGSRVVGGIHATPENSLRLATGLIRAVQTRSILIPLGREITDDFNSIKRLVNSGRVTYKAATTVDGHSDRFSACAHATMAANDCPAPVNFRVVPAASVRKPMRSTL